MCICRTTCSYSCAAVDSISADTARRAVRLQVCVALAGQEQSRAVVAGRPVAALVRPGGWSLFDRCVTNARRPSDRTGSGDQANYAPKRNDAS